MREAAKAAVHKGKIIALKCLTLENKKGLK